MKNPDVAFGDPGLRFSPNPGDPCRRPDLAGAGGARTDGNPTTEGNGQMGDPCEPTGNIPPAAFNRTSLVGW